MRFRFPDLNKNVSEEYRGDFNHLYMDVLWFGILNGSSISFITIYFARISATGTQIGLLGALPAIVALIFTLPVGTWLQHGNSDRKVINASFIHRIFYLLWVPIPLLFIDKVQIELLLSITFIMSIPGTILQVGFNSIFAESVPINLRGYVAGVRNALFAIVTILATLISGQILIKLVFPINYQVVFGIGFIGAMMSSVHLWLLIHRRKDLQNSTEKSGEVLRRTKKKRSYFFRLVSLYRFKWPEIKENRHFYTVMGLLFFFHIAQYLCIPVFPVFWVNNLHLSDNIISLGTGAFFVTVFLGSTQISKLSIKHGNKAIVGIGAMLMALYPGIMAFSNGIVLYMVASLIGGLAWAFVGGLLVNYLLEKIPEQNRPTYLAIYYLIFYAAVLIGSLAGPEIGKIIGIPTALFIFGLLRLSAGAAIIWRG
jgi:MFS family permease